jgi:predicted amidohydrolase
MVEEQKSEPANIVKIAVLNFKILGMQDLESHMKRIDAFAAESKSKGAKYLLLPELIVFDMLPINPPDQKMIEYLTALSNLSGEYEGYLKKISMAHNLNIVGASTVIKTKNHFINRSFYVAPTGSVLYQDKMQPTPWEAKYGFVGEKQVRYFETEDFSFVILICHDAEFPTISSRLVGKRPEVIFVPSQTGSDFGLKRVRYTSMARSIEHMSYVLMTGASGNKNVPWHTYIGQNFFITPQNEYFENMEKSGPHNKESLSIFELDISKLRQSRQDFKQVYPARDVRVINGQIL